MNSLGQDTSRPPAGPAPSVERIPRLAHYVWLGGRPLPDDAKRLIEGWHRVLPDFEIKEWNERTFDVQQHPWMQRTHDEGRFSFASDYVRFKVLEEQGGIYLDTDVELRKSLVPFLRDRCFFSFEFDSFLSTCLIGAEPGHPLIRAILGKFDHMDGCQVSNIYWTRHMIDTYPALRLNNREQYIGDGIRILPKEYFIVPGYGATANFARHHAKGTWKPGGGSSRRPHWLRRVLGEVLFFKLVNLRMNWNSEFRRLEKGRR